MTVMEGVITLVAVALVVWIIRIAWLEMAEDEKKRDKMKPWRPDDDDRWNGEH